MRMRKLLFFIALLCMHTGSHAQYHLLKGSWVTPAQENILIADTTGLKNYNYWTNADLYEEHFRLLILGDTLSFRKTYTSSRTNFKVQHLDRYDLKLITLTDSLLVVSPASSFSKNFWKNQEQITFQRQDYTLDSALELEWITFHTTGCFGTCNTYHLQVDRTGTYKLHKAVVYNQETDLKDSTAAGYFTGKLPDSLFQPLLFALRTINLRNLKMNSHFCCDAPLLTIIPHFNGQSRYFKTMFYPRMSTRLVIALYNICRYSNGKRTNEKFTLEE
ncbi:hypothetical protein FAM09_29555 [Niastella caeni]|uniref:DUF6438 domain-containing protein n=1 Tax=Niastella caeni TaxID=2569763 RepID=A0A4S8H9M5_9BACT|nr:DUF6438 domain-containing protein [Niastella caeni]THU30749.1 hypothetical protein FAM09_29555 [Niastella caeni]